MHEYHKTKHGKKHDYKTFKKVIDMFNKKAVEALFSGKQIAPGSGIGYFSVLRIDRSFVRKGKPNLQINWGATKKEGKRIVFTDEHYYRIYWSKARCSYKNKTVYSFNVAKPVRRSLSKLIQEDPGQALLTYKASQK